MSINWKTVLQLESPEEIIIVQLQWKKAVKQIAACALWKTQQ